MDWIEVVFPVLGTTLPTDHAYPLFAALAGIVPRLHEREALVAIAAIDGQYQGRGSIALTDRSRLRIRLPVEEIASLLPLGGKSLTIAGRKIRLGVPSVAALMPASSLVARLVTIKNAKEPESFLAAVQEKLAGMNISGATSIPAVTQGTRAGLLTRKVVRIKDKRVIGYGLEVTGLAADESVQLQSQPDPATAFGRRKLGCAFFVPVRINGSS